jgi:hypothetical protein
MPQRTLRIDIQVDDVFVYQIGTHVKAQWGQMTKDEQAVVGVLVKALNDARQVKTSELYAAACPISASLDEIVGSLRTKHHIPVLVSVGSGGGYRLPISRAECNLYLQAETAVLFRKIERVVTTYRAMAEYGATKPEGMDSLTTLFKAYKLQSIDGQSLPAIKHERRRR